MNEGYIKFSKNKFRDFEYYIKKNNEELHKNQIAYEVKWGDNEFYYVRLIDDSLMSLKDILKKMDIGVDKSDINL